MASIQPKYFEVRGDFYCVSILWADVGRAVLAQIILPVLWACAGLCAYTFNSPTLFFGGAPTFLRSCTVRIRDRGFRNSEMPYLIPLRPCRFGRYF